MVMANMSTTSNYVADMNCEGRDMFKRKWLTELLKQSLQRGMTCQRWCNNLMAYRWVSLFFGKFLVHAFGWGHICKLPNSVDDFAPQMHASHYFCIQRESILIALAFKMWSTALKFDYVSHLIIYKEISVVLLQLNIWLYAHMQKNIWLHIC